MKVAVLAILCALLLHGCSTSYRQPIIMDEWKRRTIVDCIYNNSKCRGGLWL